MRSRRGVRRISFRRGWGGFLGLAATCRAKQNCAGSQILSSPKSEHQKAFEQIPPPSLVGSLPDSRWPSAPGKTKKGGTAWTLRSRHAHDLRCAILLSPNLLLGRTNSKSQAPKSKQIPRSVCLYPTEVPFLCRGRPTVATAALRTSFLYHKAHPSPSQCRILMRSRRRFKKQEPAAVQRISVKSGP